MGLLLSGAYNRTENIIDQYARQPGQADFLYRSSHFVGEGAPQRAGFSAPSNVTLPYTNPEARDLQTGSDAAAYAKLYPGGVFNTAGRFDDSRVRIPALPSLTRQIVKNDRIGITGAYQWDVTDRTRLSIDGLYSRLLDANVTNGLADYLVLRNVDVRSAVDYSEYTTEFWQGSARLDHQFTDTLKMVAIYGKSKSSNNSQGLLVEFNRMDSPQNFVYDERGDGPMPLINFGFDVANPANWQVVKGFSAIRHLSRLVRNEFEGIKVDFDLELNDRFNLAFGGTIRRFGFFTSQAERNTDTLNPTLLEAGSNTAANSKIVEFGRGLDTPEGTAASFLVPDLNKFEQLLGFTCNCINKFGDWRLTTKRNGGSGSFGVSEKDTALYLQADFNTEIFGQPLRGNAGTRVAITDVTSNGTTQAGRPIVGKNKYTDWLPSLNLVYQPTRELYLRFGASEVIARPLLGNLSPTITSISVPSNGDNSGVSFTIGNPRLSPFRSTNYDASVEWYFTRFSLISLAAFTKNVSSFPQTVIFYAPLSELVDAETATAIRAQYTNTAQLAYIDANNPFNARQYRGAPGGYIRGIEANFRQNLTFLPGPLRNLGVLLNYTYVKSKLNYILDPGAAATATAAAIPQTTGTGPFIGVSPKAFNATVFYEVDGFRARVSVANRKGYVSQFPIAAGSCSPGLLTASSGRAFRVRARVSF